MSEDKLQKVKAHRAKMHSAIMKTVEAKIATATMYGMTEAEAALRQCLDSLKAVP